MRALRILLIVLVVLGGAFVAVDRAAVYFAESEAEGRVRITGGSAGSTDVSIKGFPFLTQVAGSRFDQVDVELTGIRASAGGRAIRISEMRAQLHDVTLGSGYSSATAARATGTAVVNYEDLTSAANDGVAVEYGGDGKVKVTGTVDILGRPVSRSVLSTVTLVDGRTIRVHADKVPGEGIPGLEDLVRGQTDFEREIGGLPDGLKLEKVEVTRDGLEISVTGSDVALTG
ncbi:MULTISPECIES: LmeA family phospholipid-binding protein [unclassified Streptomyces]|uniref:LmeA family phospholipid-binding protein n=1 Tax=Streptomyces sp. NPDC127532 TaxID=3345399 RepID=UPI00364573A7